MALVLDTNALSAFADGDARLRAALATESELALPAIVLGEYLFGIAQSRHRGRYENWLDTHLRVFLLLSVGPTTAAHYAEIRSELKSAGQPIPSNDVWIAALTREYRFALLSRDKHFAFVPDLKWISW